MKHIPIDVSKLDDYKEDGTIKLYSGIQPDDKIVIEVSHTLPTYYGVFYMGEVEIAQIPSGMLTQEIVEKILEAYHKKGSMLMLKEVMPFYEERG